MFFEVYEMRGCLLIVASFGGGLALALGLISVLDPLIGNWDVATAIGTAFWILFGLTTMMFGSLWIGDFDRTPDQFANPSSWQRWQLERRKVRAESKLQTAELRVGLVYAGVVGALAYSLKANGWTVAILAIGFALLGGTVGHIFRRLVVARRAQSNRDVA